MIKKWIHKENRFSLLFYATLMALVLPTIFHHELIADTMFLATFSLMVIAGIYALQGTRRFRLAILTGAITLVVSWLAILDFFDKETGRLSLVTFLFFFSFLFYQVLLQVIREKKVNAHVIMGSITSFLLLGYVGGIYFITLENVIPGSFNLPPDGTADNLVYFSFVTMTTLGYGDIAPVTDTAQRSSIILAIAGQFYMAVVVATLVSKWANDRGK